MRKKSKPPLVAHIIYALGTGGLENGLINIINRVPAERYRHAIICLTESTEFSKRITATGVTLIQLHKRPGHDPGLYWRLWRTLRDLRPDIIHTRNLAALEMQFLTLLMLGVRRVHGEHGRDIYDLEGKNRKYNLLRKAISPFIHCYIAVSRDLQLWLNETVGVPMAKIRQIYNGIDLEKFSPCTTERPELAPKGFMPDDPFVFGTVGRLVEVKDQRALILALHHLISHQPQLSDRLRLIIVGDGPMHQTLLKMVEELNLSHSVWLTGDRGDVSEILRMLDLFILPSLAEGISNTILEAMATGLPVIATDVGGTPEIIDAGINGTLIPVSSSEALANAITKFIQYPETLNSMGQNGRQKVQTNFCWDRTVNEYLLVYDKLLDEAGQRPLPTT